MKKVEEEREGLVVTDKLEFCFENWGDSGKRNGFVSVEELEGEMGKEEGERVGNRKMENSERLLSQILSKEEHRNNKKVHTHHPDDPSIHSKQQKL